MSKTRIRIYKLRKKVLMLMAALPMLQATGTCDLIGASGFFAQDFGQNLAFNVFSSVVRGVSSSLLAFFPSADAVNLLLGGNPNPFFRG